MAQARPARFCACGGRSGQRGHFAPLELEGSRPPLCAATLFSRGALSGCLQVSDSYFSHLTL